MGCRPTERASMVSANQLDETLLDPMVIPPSSASATLEITLPDMYRGVIPFIVLELIALGLVMAYPGLALWLPSKVLGFD